MEKNYINIFDNKISYIEVGQGDPVVILHGWGANIESVMPIVNMLADRYKVYAYDAPGFGNSDDPKKVLSTHDYSLYLEEFLKAKKISKAIFFGHSFGGKTLSIFAAEHPEKVSKLVLIDASGVLPKRTMSYYFKVYSFKSLRWIYTKLNFFKGKEEAMRKFYEKFGSDDYKASQGVMRKTFVKVVNEDTVNFFGKIKAPTLLIWGENDQDTPVYMGKVFEEKIKDSGLVILKGAGHYSYLDDYGTFVAVINSFLE
ncbi:MAG: alpha/beta fold hydrolase [Peptoniphilaceae bacterium]